MRVDPATAVIAVDGSRLEIRNDRVTYALNKPAGVLTAMSDDRGRPCVGDMVGDLAKGLVHVAASTRTPRACSSSPPTASWPTAWRTPRTR